MKLAMNVLLLGSMITTQVFTAQVFDQHPNQFNFWEFYGRKLPIINGGPNSASINEDIFVQRVCEYYLRSHILSSKLVNLYYMRLHNKYLDL